MNPQNMEILAPITPIIGCLANNHVVDWGWDGFSDTLYALKKNEISFCGGGLDEESARRPVVLNIPGSKKRIFIFGVDCEDSGIPVDWAARGKRLIHWGGKLGV
jgi:poly-gamma-glutamate synthesis protein (capsule biosynthesis protein)